MYVYVCLCMSMYVYVYVLAMTFAGLRIVLIIVAIHRSAADPITTGVSPPQWLALLPWAHGQTEFCGWPKETWDQWKTIGIIMDHHGSSWINILFLFLNMITFLINRQANCEIVSKAHGLHLLMQVWNCLNIGHRVYPSQKNETHDKPLYFGVSHVWASPFIDAKRTEVFVRGSIMEHFHPHSSSTVMSWPQGPIETNCRSNQKFRDCHFNGKTMINHERNVGCFKVVSNVWAEPFGGPLWRSMSTPKLRHRPTSATWTL